MVKADVKHNYYADLELPTNCSLDDIKKQYRKLALLYHPDRNAGKEEEYVPRFQAIQTAHEILGDAGQKSRYDADRRKAGLSTTGGVGGGGGGGSSYNTRPSPAQPTGNPYQATSAYPPPPRRTQPGTWQRPQASGAGRFNNFPRSTPTARKDPAQDRTNMFKAWQNMNNPQDRQQQRTTPGSASSTTAQTGASTPTPNRPRPPPPPPRQDPKMPSEEEIRAGMNYRKPPPQFDGDRADRGQSAWASFQQKNQGKPGVSRSSTTKTPRKQGFDPSAPGSDERPAGGNSGYAQRHRSEDYGRPQPGQTFPPPPPGPPPQSPPSTRTSPTAQRPFADPLRPFKSRTSDDGAPYSEANRRRTPYSSFSGEKFHFQREENDNLRRSASTRDTSKLDPNSTHASRARSTSPLGRQAQNNNQAQGDPRKPFVDYSDSDDSDEHPSPDDLEGTSPNGNRRPGTVPQSQTPFERPKKVPTPPSQRFGGSSQPFSPPPPSSDANQAEPMQQKTSNNIFSFPISPDLFTPNGKSKSTENINTQFSPEGWNGEFKGSPDYFSSAQPSARKASSPFRRDKSNLRSSAARNASASTSRHGSVSDMPPPPPPPPPKAPSGSDEDLQQQRQFQDTPSGGPTFSREEWEKHFQEPSWAWPPPPQPPSPSKVSAAKSRGSKKSSRAPKTGNNGESQAFGDSSDANAGPEVAEDDAMDIDTPPTSKPAEAPQAETDSSKEPRLYSVPPSQWRQQQQAQVNGHGRPSSSRGVSGEEADLKTNLDDLANVEPMTKGPEGGLKNLSDLSSTLPFQSQPSTAPPRQSFEPQKLTIPPIPKAPEQPSKLTRQTWQTFAHSFGDYLQAYHHFNSIMLQHFTSRESHDQSRFAEGTAWLEAVGDPAGMTPSGPIGFGSYLQGVREDESVREAWNLGCERHTEACKGFEKVRERVRKLVGNGGWLITEGVEVM
ncbi:hypothetical protein BTJ68_09810 [Hortaea werneckii EXF-2000]|uniref:J domain-containing protein n=1 Tax=Hortaea werneckii EXF-2000 TaxID=1157616 RepID=A0A1Z5T208_HORWE|nr:hypothetical protein BTJ68_09810 [Hortaea werneckii EXF-2000]